MRLLVVTPFLPDTQAEHGGGAYLATLLGGLAEVAEVGLVALCAPSEERRWPAGGPWHQGWSVARTDHRTGLPGLTARCRHLWRWRRLPLVAAKHWEPRLAALLPEVVRTFAPDAVMVELAQMAQYLPFLDGVPTVLTDHEAGCPTNTRTGLGAWGDARDRRLWRGYVRRFYPRATVVQAVTAEDAAVLHGVLGRDVVVRPPVVAVPATPVLPEAAPPRALFLGDYRHGPNPEAARRLVHDVLPLLRAEAPDTELWLAGANSDRIADLARVPGVRVAGFVADLRSLFVQVRLLLAPVYSGGGFRMKVLTALAHGIPVVTNALGARGLPVPGDARRIAETAPDLAAAALPWLRSPAAAAAAGRAAFAWAQGHASPRVVAQDQIARVQALAPARTRG